MGFKGHFVKSVVEFMQSYIRDGPRIRKKNFCPMVFRMNNEMKIYDITIPNNTSETLYQ